MRGRGRAGVVVYLDSVKASTQVARNILFSKPDTDLKGGLFGG